MREEEEEIPSLLCTGPLNYSFHSRKKTASSQGLKGSTVPVTYTEFLGKETLSMANFKVKFRYKSG